MNVIMYERGLLGRALNQPNAVMSVQRYSHSVFGGPVTARLKGEGKALDLWELIERLRCPVEIFSDRGDCVWWGFVDEVEVKDKNVTFSVSLDSMYNAIAVAYNEVESGSTSIGQRATSAWSVDAESVAIYGRRELLQTISGSTSGHAVEAREMLLASKRFPVPTISMNMGDGKKPSASVICRGWWSSLDWQYFGQPEPADVDTGGQVALMAAAKGQFFKSVSGITSGIVTSSFRDGDGRASYEIEELMKMGTSNRRRLLASVDKELAATITEEPALGIDTAFLDSKGNLKDRFDNPLRRETCPVGMWTRLKDVIPATADTTRLSDPTLAFIDEAEYDVAADVLKFTPRDVENPWEIGRPKDG